MVVIHPGSRTLCIGRATDTLPLTIPHVIARRHKQSGQPRYEDPWLLREGLNVSNCTSHSPLVCFIPNIVKWSWHWLHFSFPLFFFVSNRNQRVTNRGRTGSKWLIRPSGQRRCQTVCEGLLCLLIRFVHEREKWRVNGCDKERVALICVNVSLCLCSGQSI